MPKKTKNILITNSGLILAPCSWCSRKPGYFYNGKNYCWFHWFQHN